MRRRFMFHAILFNSGILFLFPLGRELLHTVVLQYDAFT